MQRLFGPLLPGILAMRLRIDQGFPVSLQITEKLGYLSGKTGHHADRFRVLSGGEPAPVGWSKERK